MNDRERIDIELVRRGLFSSREKAQAAIMAGQIYIGEKKIQKGSEAVSSDDDIHVRALSPAYVSRGALKLEKAIQVFHADFSDRVIIDIGASTGGFTDVCLQNGARRVYSVDVGYGQLDWKLRNDPRVSVMERTNARYLTRDMFSDIPSIAVMDVSFISIKLILPAAVSVIGDKGEIYSLIKPQFEAGRSKVGKKGVVRDPDVHCEVLEDIIRFTETIGWRMDGLSFSPITGPEGNIEFISHIVKRTDETSVISKETVREIVENAHASLKTC